MTTPDQATDRLAEVYGVDKGRPTSQATQIIEIAQEMDLWHSNGEPYGTLEVNGHSENWSLKGSSVRQWLSMKYYRQSGTAPSSQAIQNALDTLRGQAVYEGEDHRVFTRVGEAGGRTYVDLCNESWEVVEIDAIGWRVRADAPVKFRRTRNMLALPSPSISGDIGELRNFVNLESDDDWMLIVAWLVQSLSTEGSYPVLPLNGEQGTAKSTVSRVLKACIDPNTSPLRSPPRNEHDLLIAATNSWCVALDNLSGLRPWLSDALCRLSTGGGLGTRQLFTDEDEIIFDVRRPVILNGINELATRSDLLDRSIPMILPVIPEDRRLSEAEFWTSFDGARPNILGGLLDAVSGAMRNLPVVRLDRAPRMVDYSRRGVAVEMTLDWAPGSFIAAYQGNRAGANEMVLESSPVTVALVSADLPDGWTGKAADLLEKLEGVADEATLKHQDWPPDAARLGQALRRLAPNLRGIGIDIQFDHPTRRHITIRTEPQNTDNTDLPTRQTSEGLPEAADEDDGSGVSSDIGRDGIQSTVTPRLDTVMPSERGGEAVDRVDRDSSDGDDSRKHPYSASILGDGRRRIRWDS